MVESPDRSAARTQTKPGRRRRLVLPGLFLLATITTLLGCGALRRDLPMYQDVPKADPLPIDGVWHNETFDKRFRFEAGRTWILDPWVVGPVRLDPGQVTGIDMRQTGPRNYSGKDIGGGGPWSAELTEAGLAIVSPGPVGPVRSLAVVVELDDRAWFDAQLASNSILSRSGVPTGGASVASFSLTAADASKPLQIGDRAAFGRYHAIVIGNNGYRHLPKLATAAGDAKVVTAVLRDQYGFQVTLMQDATRAQILTQLRKLRETLTESDNLLIYYAGHGWLDKEADEGYWLPVDAEPDSDINWISNATITGYLRSIQAKNVMIVADSCYSGTLTRGIKLDVKPPDYLQRMARLRSRVVLSSGGLEPVADGGGGQHSAFARHFIDELRANEGVIDSTTLYARIRRPVMLAADQAPELADIRKAGHEGGDFLFIRETRASPSPR